MFHIIRIYVLFINLAIIGNNLVIIPFLENNTETQKSHQHYFVWNTRAAVCGDLVVVITSNNLVNLQYRVVKSAFYAAGVPFQ